ncbi:MULTISPECIES: hypothetical protein [Asticcacaulis]|uniref:hypothetical protein n=1 Tax=Asticcacaulis TaxID=76890 RepID=UPI001AE0EFFC|nr:MULTISPECIES: hypothetical protein [Asticcacaulis]MBP2158151.1 hypothetical protein [Asticcacaulis solisilvae]MDR6799196.1 hypothetical protein [Asticcacaulis sp. BE141]
MDAVNLDDTHIKVRWKDLEVAWDMLATPEKQAQVADTLAALKVMSRNVGPEKIVFTMIAATAWLTDDGPAFPKDWQA